MLCAVLGFSKKQTKLEIIHNVLGYNSWLRKMFDQICNFFAHLVVLITQDKHFVARVTLEPGKGDFSLSLATESI